MTGCGPVRPYPQEVRWKGARGFPLGLTIIGVPLGLANFKIIPVTLVPLGVRIVPEDSL